MFMSLCVLRGRSRECCCCSCSCHGWMMNEHFADVLLPSGKTAASWPQLTWINSSRDPNKDKGCSNCIDWCLN